MDSLLRQNPRSVQRLWMLTGRARTTASAPCWNWPGTRVWPVARESRRAPTRWSGPAPGVSSRDAGYTGAWRYRLKPILWQEADLLRVVEAGPLLILVLDGVTDPTTWAPVWQCRCGRGGRGGSAPDKSADLTPVSRKGRLWRRRGGAVRQGSPTWPAPCRHSRSAVCGCSGPLVKQKSIYDND